MATAQSLNYAQSLYVAYYGRPAEQAGLTYWADRADAEGNDAIVNAFGTSEEYTQLSNGLSSAGLINNLYQQMFGRAAETAGVNYYSGLLDSGESSLAQIAVSIMSGAQGSDRLVLNAKEQAADYYTNNVSSYNVDQARSLLASIDDQDTVGDFNAVIQQINGLQDDVGGVAADYQTLLSANTSLSLAEANLTSAFNDLQNNSSARYAAYSNQDGDDTDAVEIADIRAYLQDQQVALQESVIRNGSDADLQQDVTDAASAVRSVSGRFDAAGQPATGTGTVTYSANQLFNQYQSAEQALAADVTADGSTNALATDLNAAVAAYSANNPGNADLGTLQTAITTYLGGGDEAAFLDAVDTAYSAVFSDNNGASNLNDGAAGDNVESLLTTLDQRNDLSDAVASTQAAISNAAGQQFTNYQTALNAVETREELRNDISDAQSDLATLQPLNDAVTAAQADVTNAQNELGYEPVEISGAGPFGNTGSADLFVFDKDSAQTSAITLENNDAIYLGSGYTQGSFAADGTTPAGNNGALEYFFNANTGVLTVEKFADGDASNVELSLTSDGSAQITGISVTDDGVLTVA